MDTDIERFIFISFKHKNFFVGRLVGKQQCDQLRRNFISLWQLYEDYLAKLIIFFGEFFMLVEKCPLLRRAKIERIM